MPIMSTSQAPLLCGRKGTRTLSFFLVGLQLALTLRKSHRYARRFLCNGLRYERGLIGAVYFSNKDLTQSKTTNFGIGYLLSGLVNHKMKVELQLQATNLKTVDYGVPDAYAVVSRLPVSGDPDRDEIGETEVIEGTLNIQWEKVFHLDFESGTDFTLRVSVFDQGQQEGNEIPLGSAVFEISRVLHTKNGEESKSIECGGRVTVTARKPTRDDISDTSVLQGWYDEKGMSQRRGSMANIGSEKEVLTNEDIAKQWILQERNASRVWLQTHRGSLSVYSRSLESIDSPTVSETASRGNDSLHTKSQANTIASTEDNSLRAGWFQIKDHAKILAVGQLLSFLIASAGAAQASLYLECEVSAPSFTIGISYLLLSLHLVPLTYKSRRRRSGTMDQRDSDDSPYSIFGCVSLRAPVWAYLLLAFLDVEGNYATLTAFRYTTVTSILLFDSLSIPSAMLLSKLFLSRRYMAIHLLGATFCMSGMLYNVFSDYESDLAAQELEAINEGSMEAIGDEDYGSEPYPNRLAGDILAILGALLCGVNDVFAEMGVRNYGGPMEFLGMIGLLGALISFMQVLLFEIQSVSKLFESSEEDSCSATTRVLLLLSMVAANTLRYLGTAQFLLWSEAALLNLSCVTVVLWSILFSVFVQHILPQPLFYVALTMMISGVIVYAMGPSPIQEEQADRPIDVLVPRSNTTTSHDKGNREQKAREPPRVTQV